MPAPLSNLSPPRSLPLNPDAELGRRRGRGRGSRPLSPLSRTRLSQNLCNPYPAWLENGP